MFLCSSMLAQCNLSILLVAKSSRLRVCCSVKLSQVLVCDTPGEACASFGSSIRIGINAACSTQSVLKTIMPGGACRTRFGSRGSSRAPRSCLPACLRPHCLPARWLWSPALLPSAMRPARVSLVRCSSLSPPPLTLPGAWRRPRPTVSRFHSPLPCSTPILCSCAQGHSNVQCGKSTR